MEDGSRRIRPAIWVGIGVLLSLIGIGLGVDVAPTLARLGQVARAQPCSTEFARGCTTERAAYLEPQGWYPGRSWIAGDERWWARVPDGPPGTVYGPGRERFDVPRQEGQHDLVAGMTVTLVYYGESPAWIRLPSGKLLETEGHPRRQAPTLALVALGFLGGGSIALRTGIESGGHGDGWLRPTQIRARGGLDVAVLLGGMLAAFALGITGGIVWLGVAGGLLGTGLGILVWVLPRRAGRDRRGAADPTDGGRRGGSLD